MSHTPGPWNTLTTDGLVVLGGDGRPVGSAWSDGRPECCANARLMAAAPDLLDALEYILAWSSGGEMWDPEKSRDMAIAAIAKARGETS